MNNEKIEPVILCAPSELKAGAQKIMCRYKPVSIEAGYTGSGKNQGNETAVESDRRKQINRHIFTQTDIRYIINPGGHISKLNNSLTAILGLGTAL